MNNNVDILVERAITLSDTVNDHYYDLGEVLYTLKENNLYKTIDDKKYWSEKHTEWKQFCEDKLSISYRTAQYYLNMYRYFTKMEIGKEELRGIGWSKAKELIDVTEDAETLERCLEVARTRNLQELQAYISEFVDRKTDTEESIQGRTFRFKLYGAVAERAAEILSIASRSTNNDQNDALVKVLIEWFQLTNPIKDASDLVELKDMELVFEVNV